MMSSNRWQEGPLAPLAHSARRRPPPPALPSSPSSSSCSSPPPPRAAGLCCVCVGPPHSCFATRRARTCHLLRRGFAVYASDTRVPVVVCAPCSATPGMDPGLPRRKQTSQWVVVEEVLGERKRAEVRVGLP